MKESPAPTVSATSTGCTGCSVSPAAVAHRIEVDPRVTTTMAGSIRCHYTMVSSIGRSG